MRRGHAGIGGWRNEHPRHFKSRSSNSSHFRSSRNYRLLDSPRFPPPISRSLRPPYHPHSENQDQNISENVERNRYKINRHNRYNEHHEPYQKPHQQGERQMLPLLQQSRFNNDHRNTFQDTTINHQFYDDSSIHINSMGDVDHRHFNTHQRESFRHPPFSNPWAPETNIQPPIERPHNKPHNLDKETYTGHRPPASDHYGCNPTHSFSTIDNSRTFSRSVDDTVDIVRKRLLNRNEPQNIENYDDNQNSSNVDSQRLSERGDCLTNSQQEPAKKRYQKQKHTAKTNCAKIKNKIVHQLFKMDKEKIHKLMDNPNSSHKFEYAISSLITESQNSFNRHLRSTAEKSLCSTSAEFIENDNNTIYEDTFLKQMQCILDPQDTVFLEDIKPIVMAELTKVLQIDEFEQKLSISEDDSSYTNQEEPHNYNQYKKHKQGSYEEYSKSSFSQNLPHSQNPRRKSSDGVSSNHVSYEHDGQTYDVSNKPYFYRRARSKSYNYSAEVSTSSEHDFYRTVENEDTENVNKTCTQPQYFKNATEQISEEDDPFAELDQQYHVAVDPDFIENDDISTPNRSNISIITSNTINKNLKLEPQSPDKNSRIMVDIIDSQLQDTAKSPVKSCVTVSTTSPPEKTKDNSSLQSTQVLSNLNSTMLVQDKDINSVHEDTNEKSNSEPKHITKNNENTDNPTNTLKSLTTTNSRKRSIEQRPSHRKEKRKKLESCSSDSSKQDCASKASEKCETTKFILHSFFPKEENKNACKDNKKVTTIDKHYIEKHVKRKETPKKATDINKRKDSTSSQPTSPIDNNSNISNQTPSKSDIKTTLKTIDMFTEQPRKISIHHAHRNTAPTPTVTTTPKAPVDKANKEKKPLSRQIVKRHVAVQVLRKCPTKETQTEKRKLFHKAIQTDLIIPDKPGRKSNDAFERMKEIDLEIQVLLQEKFKLYNSIESKESSVNSMQTLGMTVLNVDPFDEENEIVSDVLTEDTIVDDFTSLPVEELEKIALESVSEDQIRESPTIQKRGRRRKISKNESVKSGSPASVGRRKNKKHKSPNISLIEQIITDDRPLEDIISLDDLEVPQLTIKTKNNKKQVGRKKDSCNSSVAKSKSTNNIQLKDCSVVLVRLGHSDFLKHLHSNELEKNTNEIIIEEKVDESNINILEISDQLPLKHDFVDEIVNDLHLDMLDVSEDIVVGDNCEVKSVEDKEVIESVPVPISEEIILDNSQSSIEEVLPTVSQSDECKVYDYSADENLRRDSLVVSGNADAVLAIECVETNFLAACVDGNVYYFNSEGQLITTLRGSNLAVTCLTIVKEKHGTTVYTGSLDSRIRYYDLETGLEKGPECNVLSPIQTMDRAWDTVFVGTRTGFVLQFECKNNMLIPVSSVKFSDQNILALRAMKEGPRKVLLVAARSENVTIKDAQTGLLLRTLAGPKMTVYTLLYEDGKVYCGTSSHQIHVFDYTSGTHVGTHEGGKGAVCLRASGGLLFAGCYDGCVYVYKEGEGQPFAQIRGPSLMLLSLSIVGSKIIAGYKDRSLYIWKIPLCILQEMIL